MQKKTKRAVRAAFSVLAASACLAAVCGGLSRKALLEWGGRLAMLSVGIQQPDGGAEALSGRLEREPAAGGSSTTPPTSGTKPSGTTTPPTTLPTEWENGIAWPTLPTFPEPVIPEKSSGGTVLTEQLSPGSDFVDGVAVRNSSGLTLDIADLLSRKPAISITDTAEPQVLLMHTHTTECYLDYDAGFYNDSDPTRTLDETKNVVAVGEVVAVQLQAAGIGVVHDKTVHDSPQYTGAYDRSKATVLKNLEAYPTIQVVLDIHRDSIQRDASSKVKPTAEIGGKKAAQMMIVMGMMNTASVPHPDWQENLSLAVRLQQELHTRYEGVMRPISLVGNARYNQQLTHGSILVEMGSEANTLEEAMVSGQMLGRALVKVLGDLKAMA